MRVLLIHPVHTERGQGPQPFRFINIMAVGLFSLADVLDRAGHEVQIWHLGLREVLDPGFEPGAAAVKYGPDLVGISVHWHPQLAEALDAAAAVRVACPQAKVVLGGITASLLGEELLAGCADVDFVIRGDGEQPLLQLCEHLAGERAAGDCAGLLWRDEDGGVQVNQERWSSAGDDEVGAWLRPGLMPGFERYRPPYYAMPDDPPGAYSRTDVFYLVAHRGCPHSCDYCGGCRGAQKLLRNGKFTKLGSERLIATAQQALATGRDRIYLLADNSVLGDAIFVEVARGLRGEALRELHLDVYRLPEADTLRAVRRALPDAEIVAHVTPEAGSDAYRAVRRPPELYFTNDDLQAYLTAADRAGVSSVVYGSLHPAAPDAEVTALGRLAREALARPGQRVCLSVLDLDLHAPWAGPGRYGVPQPIAGLAAYLELDRRRGREGTRYPRDLGYAYPHLGDHLALLGREVDLAALDNHAFLAYACGL